MPSQPSPSLKSFLSRLPKTETHLHVEGALPFELIQKKYPEKYAKLPDSWRDDFKFRDFVHFESELIGMASDWFVSPEAYFESCSIVFNRLFEEQNVRYIECSFASGVIDFMNLDGSKVAEAIKSAVHPEQNISLYMGIHHDGYTDRTRGFLNDCFSWDALDGIDLHGTETVPIEEWTIPFWKKAVEKGFKVKAHAGEFNGAEFVDWVIDHLGVKRIQHGVRSVENEETVARLVREKIVLDICPISNVKLDVVPTMEKHPIRKLVEAGVICTINTDDPLSFGNQLHEEYTALHDVHGFSFEELAQLAKNGFIHSSLKPEMIDGYLTEIDLVLKTSES